MVGFGQIIIVINFIFLNKALLSWDQSFCTDMRPKEPGGLENFYLISNQNRIIIRDNNSLELLNRILNTVRFAV